MSSISKQCDYAPKTNPTQVCGMEIQWNDNLKAFESVKFPGFKHQHRLVCRTEGCGGDIFFHDAAPKGERTGRPQPLEIPIPVNRAWVFHSHKKVVPVDAPVRDPLEPVPSTTGTDPATVSVQQAQDAVVKPQTNTTNIPEAVPSTAGKAPGASDGSGSSSVDLNQLELQLRWERDVLHPALIEMKERFQRVIGPIEAWVAIMARAGFQSAADIQRLGQDVVRQAEVADALAEKESNLQKNAQ